jgi:hypothetical protein
LPTYQNAKKKKRKEKKEKEMTPPITGTWTKNRKICYLDAGVYILSQQQYFLSQVKILPKFF